MIQKGIMSGSVSKLAPAGINSKGGKPYNVLIVDDSVFIIKQLTQILTSESFNIIASANDGEEGLLKYKEYYPKIDLVTLDITMPKMDGLTCLEKIVEFDKNVKVIMISALGKEKLVKDALIKGAKSYIIKPLDRLKVLERVKLVLH